MAPTARRCDVQANFQVRQMPAASMAMPQMRYRRDTEIFLFRHYALKIAPDAARFRAHKVRIPDIKRRQPRAI